MTTIASQPSGSLSANYRFDIEGLRGVAVLAVLEYHFGFFVGGFVGVDIFFVISGFLITGLIYGEMQQGKFTLLGFYDRRIRRIVPALAVLLLAVLAFGYFVLWPGDYETTGWTAVTGAFGAANLYLLSETGYFDQAVQLQPLLHLWSLGVEEQFYLVWPVALMVLGKSRRAAVIVIGVVLVASFSASAYEVFVDQSATFYLPQFRAWELALGGILNFVPLLRRQWVTVATRSLGVVMIVVPILLLQKYVPFPGPVALVPCGGAALLIWPTAGRDHLGKVLAFFAPVGAISYSLYLWHWPILVFYRHYAGGEPGLFIKFVLIAASFGVAALSWRYVERPFRRLRMPHWRVVAAGLATASVLALSALGVALSGGFADRLPPNASDMRSLAVMWDWPCPSTVTIDEQQYCSFGADWATSPHAVLWGDSHAGHLTPLLDDIGKRDGVSFIFASTCIPFAGGSVQVHLDGTTDYWKRCIKDRNDIFALIRAHEDIKLLVLSGWWSDRRYHAYDLASEQMPDAAAQLDLVRKGLVEVLKAWASSRDVVVIADTPKAPRGWSGFACALAAKALWRAPCPTLQQRSLSDFRKGAGDVDDLFGQIAQTYAGVRIVLPGEHMCESGTCVSEIAGTYVYRDGDHLRRNLDAATREKLEALMGIDDIITAHPVDPVATTP